MENDLVKRLRDWETIYPCDADKPDGSLYVEAADRIAELECHLSAICEQADRPEYSGRYAELLRRIAEARDLLEKEGRP